MLCGEQILGFIVKKVHNNCCAHVLHFFVYIIMFVLHFQNLKKCKTIVLTITHAYMCYFVLYFLYSLLSLDCTNYVLYVWIRFLKVYRFIHVYVQVFVEVQTNLANKLTETRDLCYCDDWYGVLQNLYHKIVVHDRPRLFYILLCNQRQFALYCFYMQGNYSGIFVKIIIYIKLS